MSDNAIPKCWSCGHRAHLGLCTARSGGTAYACCCSKQNDIKPEGVIRLVLPDVPVAKTTEVKASPRLFERIEKTEADGVKVTTLTRSWHLCAVPEECSACVLAMVQGLEPQETDS